MADSEERIIAQFREMATGWISDAFDRMGENQAHVAMYRGLAGVCVDGCVRDADEVAALDIPVFSRGAGVRPYSTHLELTGVNVPVAFAGVQVRPGDIVVLRPSTP